jgi:hypothetical protein
LRQVALFFRYYALLRLARYPSAKNMISASQIILSNRFQYNGNNPQALVAPIAYQMPFFMR